MPDKILEIELISIQNKKNQNNFRAWSNSVQIHKVEYSPLYREELIGHKELAKLATDKISTNLTTRKTGV